MRKNQIKNVTYLKDRRKELRNNLTPAEVVLWNALKNSQLMGRKFRRQHSIENYIADFYCPSEKLIIELDGQYHYLPGTPEQDFVRDERLNELGYTIVRFENKLVFQNMTGLLELIAKHFSD